MTDLRERAKIYEGKYAGQVKVVSYVGSRDLFILQDTGEHISARDGIYMLMGATDARVILKDGQTYIQQFWPGEGWDYPMPVNDIPHEWAEA
ncbi:MAG: hypothetical protein H8D23_10990 [Candidatus Brocadiales bacterium]|nr:hypothetical protein [Candidatus Brocadiales bacterium]